jgi:excisionase family DNA binding protein
MERPYAPELATVTQYRYFHGDMSQKESEEGSVLRGQEPNREQWLTPAEVAALFGVHPKTVTRWAKSRRLAFIRTLGGHRRYRLSDVRKLLSETPAQLPE